MIQDIYPHIFHNEFRADMTAHDDSIILCFDGKRMLISEDNMAISDDDILFGKAFPTLSKLIYEADKNIEKSFIYAFSVDETSYFLDVGQDIHTCEGFSYVDINTVRKMSSNLMGMIAFTGYHLYQWYMDSVYCGRCGGKNEFSKTERAMHCPHCDRNIYPRIMPAVIIGVTDGDRLLVTKYKGGFRHFALVAGFTEIGETLEETVEREVMEEAGLKVKNIRYYKSQPWGIANDILAGYYCDVDGSSEIHMDENELKLAEWRRRDEIELQPDNYSLTNEMMRMFKEGRNI